MEFLLLTLLCLLIVFSIEGNQERCEHLVDDAALSTTATSHNKDPNNGTRKSRGLLRACSRKRARFLPLDSHDTRRQPPLLSLIGCAHATPTSCICLYLTPLNNPLLQALLPRAFTPSPPRLRRRCRAKWRPPRPPSLERLTRQRRQPTFRCRACTVG